MIQEAIAKVAEGIDLTEEDMALTMEEITDGRATQSQIGAMLIGLRMKGESVGEITGAARVMRARSAKVPLAQSKSQAVSVDRDEINVDAETVVDTCGTGGDGTRTFNVSTTTAFVVAGAGLKVAKHGNRSVSSRCGSADVLEALGLPLDLTPEQVGRCIDEVGIGFLYAPLLHGAMRYVAAARREIGLRTIFNLLGPLTNPASANVQVLGVYRKDLTETIARVLRRLGCKSACVVHGEGTYDEISVTGPTKVTRLHHGEITTHEVRPETFGLRKADPEEIRGGDARQNADITLKVLRGESGAPRDMVLLNAAAAFVAAGASPTWAEGVELARESIDGGHALGKLNDLLKVAHRLSGEAQTLAAAG
jgi:anthranilate phosphoribosyltransferase